MSIFENLAGRIRDKNSHASAVVKAASQAHDEIRAARYAVSGDKNLSSTGQRAKLVEQLRKIAPAVQRAQRAVDRARADIAKKRSALRPRFDKTEPVILVEVARKIASMTQAEQAALLLSADKPVNPIAAQAVLELPDFVSGVGNQIREWLETALIEKMHGPAVASLAEETEAWSVADAAVRTAHGALRSTADFPSEQAFSKWVGEVAPPDAQELAAEKAETNKYAGDAILASAVTLSHDARMKLYNDLLHQAADHVRASADGG